MKVRTTIDGNKAVNIGQRGSWQHRCHAAVLQYNRGIVWVTDFLEDQYQITTAPATENFIRYIKITISHTHVSTLIVDGQQGREFLTAACGQCCESGLYVAILQRHSVSSK